MDTERMIKELNSVYEKHKNDFVPTFQVNIAAMCADIIPKLEQLKHFEDLKEQGLLLKLPCKVGDTLFRIDTDEKIENAEIEYLTIEYIVICGDGEVLFKCDAYDGVICDLKSLVNGELYLDFYRVFLTQSEAEEALKRMERG